MAERKKPERFTVIAEPCLVVRERPEKDAPIIGYIENGKSVTVKDAIDGWKSVNDGYVMAEYLK